MTYTVEHISGLAAFLRFRRNPLAFVADAGQRSLDIRSMRFGARRIFQVNHPSLIHDVLVTHDWNFVKGFGLRASRPVLGHGLLNSEGELHRSQRRLVQPAFHSTRLASYANAMVYFADQASKELTADSTVAIDQEMMQLTLRIVGLTLFGADLKHDAAGVGVSLTRALRLFLLLNKPVVQLLSPVRKLVEYRGASIRRDIELVLRQIIDEHRRNPARYDDMLSMLIRSSDEGGNGFMSDELLLDECLTLFLAGHETTANALTWTWYLLAQHTDVSEKLHAELDAVLGGRLPNLEDTPRLVYTQRVFREALRLYPPAWIIGREAVTNYRLSDVHVPAGSTLLLSPYATQRDPRYWESPEQFNPDRWIDSAKINRPRFAFFPFGAGSRVCIGEHFAMMEGMLLLATIAQKWSLRLVHNQRIELWPQITLRPRRSIFMHVERRTQPAPSIAQGETLSQYVR